ncbi:DUF3099 domain-containing protein [Dietzia psychralcaliphila]|uniref:DUF3099 family protein n=1 Tax=Dietzia psychralcaliphila TaxID=139021 RepID=A0AAD0JT82_9ACTN|nr:DUF3099 domain-containing protein [Dietzia psychralcaliphila]AWH95355.1 hypothetical protein A6048_07450 [Dietzia psychralcaliphila]PTM85479.1 Protein of unknown function (DUF3099) [Dietzia psychralcaliphila]
MAPDSRRKRSKDRDGTAKPVLITAAREPYRDELAARKKRYFLLMSIRIPALLLAAGSLALWNNPWIALAIVAGSIPIPWIAVISANDRPPLPKGQARRYTAGALSNHTPYAVPPGLVGGPARQSPPREIPARENPARENPPRENPARENSVSERTAPETPDHSDRPDESDPAP